MAWGRENNRKIVRASTPYDVERKIKAHQSVGGNKLVKFKQNARIAVCMLY